MNIELIVSAFTIMGIAIGYGTKKLIMVKNEEKRITSIEQSLIQLKEDVMDVKNNFSTCGKHSEKIAVLEADYNNIKEHIIKNEYNIESLQSSMKLIQLDIKEISVKFDNNTKEVSEGIREIKSLIKG